MFDSIFGDIRHQQRGPGAFGFGLFDDPFTRFDRLEREVDRDFSSGFFGSPFARDPFGAAFGPPPGVGFMPPFGMLPGPSTGSRISTTMDGGRWVSESYMTQTINGVTQSVHTRRDANVGHIIFIRIPSQVTPNSYPGRRTCNYYHARWTEGLHYQWRGAATGESACPIARRHNCITGSNATTTHLNTPVINSPSSPSVHKRPTSLLCHVHGSPKSILTIDGNTSCLSDDTQ